MLHAMASMVVQPDRAQAARALLAGPGASRRERDCAAVDAP